MLSSQNLNIYSMLVNIFIISINLSFEYILQLYFFITKNCLSDIPRSFAVQLGLSCMLIIFLNELIKIVHICIGVISTLSPSAYTLLSLSISFAIIAFVKSNVVLSVTYLN